jgi:hypothetical protein
LPADRPRTLRAGAARWLATLALAATVCAVTATPVLAHAGLTSSNPVDGATLTAPPTRIEFTFDEPLLEDTETISINDINGTVVSSQQVTPSGSTMSVPWPSDLTSGTFQVAYRVVSNDGHPVIGAITFTITAPAAASNGPSPAPEPVPVATGAGSSAPPGPTSSDSPPVAAIVGGLALLAAAALAVAVALRRRRDLS